MDYIYLQFHSIACLLIPALPILLGVLKEIACIARVPYPGNYRRLKGMHKNTTSDISIAHGHQQLPASR